MNDKIKELLRKNEIYHDTHLMVDYNTSDSSLEELIKSVIKECANIALDEQHEPHECILNNFGIKYER